MSGVRGCSIGAVVAGLAVTLAAPALANEASCDTSGSWILASVARPPPQGLNVRDVLERLAVEVRGRGLSMCSIKPSSPPAHNADATVTIGAALPGPSRPGARVQLDVEVRAHGSSKRMSREVDVAAVPRDSRATVVALAADELLRAAQDELALEGGSTAAGPSPPQASTASPAPSANAEPAPTPPSHASAHPPGRGNDDVDADTRPSHARDRLSIGVRAASEWWTGGLALFGGDGALSLRVAPRLRLEMDAGARASLASNAPDGGVEAQALAGRLGASVIMTSPSARPELALAARLAGYLVRMAGDPRLGANADVETSGAMTIEAGPRFSIAFDRSDVALIVDAALAVAPRGVVARDAGLAVTGLSGFGGFLSVGVSLGVL